MKPRTFLFIAFFFSFLVPATAQKRKTARKDSIQVGTLARLTELESHLQYSTYHGAGIHRIYPTGNKYNFLQLNTQTGQVQQLQWSLDHDEEFSVWVNRDTLGGDLIQPIGTFELIQTDDLFQFLLQNTITGEVWHLQWGLEEKQRGILKIKDAARSLFSRRTDE